MFNDVETNTNPTPWATGRGADSILSSHIYQLRLTSRTYQAIYAWRDTLNLLYQNAGYIAVRTLSDTSQSLLPGLAYASLLSDLWTAHHTLHSRNAILCSQLVPPEADALLAALPGYGNNVVRFFGLADREQARRWLLTDD